LKGLNLPVILITVISISGCATLQRSEKNSGSFMDVYTEAVKAGKLDAAGYIKENLKLRKSFGYVKPYVPVMKSPEVKAAWIPTHKSQEDPHTLVAGHWVYIMVRESKWFIEDQIPTKVKIPLVIPTSMGNKED